MTATTAIFRFVRALSTHEGISPRRHAFAPVQRVIYESSTFPWWIIPEPANIFTLIYEDLQLYDLLKACAHETPTMWRRSKSSYKEQRS